MNLPTHVKVLLATGAQTTRRYLRGLIQSQQDMEIVGECTDPIGILVAMAKSQAKVVLIDLLDSETDPGICSHLLSEFPDLLIFALSSGLEQAIIYRQSISKEYLLEISKEEILSAIRRVRSDE